MSLIVFQHHVDEGPAQLGRVLTQYGHRLRVLHLYAGDAVPTDLDDVDGVLCMGGPMDVDQVEQYPWLADEMNYIRAAHGSGLPVVGLCLGAQLIGAALGGEVAAMKRPEAGWGPVKLAFPGTVDPVLAGQTWASVQMHAHGCEVATLPPDSTPLAQSPACRHQAFRVGLRTYAFQYHFEWTTSEIEVMVRDPLFDRAGVSLDDVRAGAEAHFDQYRRQGDRLCHAIAQLVFPASV